MPSCRENDEKREVAAKKRGSILGVKIDPKIDAKIDAKKEMENYENVLQK